MTEELKQLREALRRVKHEAASLADAQVIALEALTQRPAAQAGEREVFEAWADANVQSDYSKSDRHCMWWGWQARASLPTQPAAQDEREADEVFLPRRLAATQKLTQLGYRYDSAHGKWLPAPQQATPEPVGEVFQFNPMPEGWPARFRCDSCDGNGELGELVSMGDFQPPERQTCPDCGGRGWTSEEHAFNADHMREFAEAHALLTRPAPGVPEGWRIFRTHDGLDVHTPDGDACYVESKATGDRRIPEEVLHALCCDLLAAAQAKGADK